MKVLSFFTTVFLLSLFLMAALDARAQTVTIVNYNFDTGSSYGTLTPTLASGITSTASGTETFALCPGSSCGTATSAVAFTANGTAGKALDMGDSSGTNTKYYQFQLGGASLSSYGGYRIYFQATRATQGAQTVTVAYQPNCTGSYVNFATTMTVATTWASSPTVFDVNTGAGSALNFQTSNCFRLLASGAGGAGVLNIDNFQIQAQIPTAASVNLSGRVSSFDGNAISRARVSMVDSSGAVRTALTNQFGYYRFTEVPSGAVYVLSVRSKLYEFAQPTQVISASEDVSDVNFTALPSVFDFVPTSRLFGKIE